MAERAAGAGALLAVAVCCGLPPLAGAAVVVSVLARSILVGVVVLGLLTVAAVYRVRRRRGGSCAARGRDHGGMS